MLFELKNFKKKTISKTELENILHTESDAELYRLVSDAVEGGMLSPIKASGTNGNRTYPVYLKYRITVGEDVSEVLTEISFLHPMITQTGYLQMKPDLYIRYKRQIQMLNSYLFQVPPCVPISKKERSFAVFGEEKQMEDAAFCNLLERLGLTPEVLQYYETPEYCFHDYIPAGKERMTLLICENKDIWFNIRRRMYEDHASRILGTQIDGVVYGCGNRVSELGALSAYTRFLGADHVQYLYWGDIDRAGMNIYLSVTKNNPALDIRLFAPAYQQMLRLAENREMPDSRDSRGRLGDYTSIYACFADEDKNLLSEYLRTNKRIPQEIINYEHLLDFMR